MIPDHMQAAYENIGDQVAKDAGYENWDAFILQPKAEVVEAFVSRQLVQWDETEQVTLQKETHDMVKALYEIFQNRASDRLPL